MNREPRPLSASVVLPTYNRQHLVVDALQSALDQIEPQDEIIVVDDGSTDETPEVLEPFLDRIRYFRHENAGQVVTRNLGVGQATKDLVFFLDDDDEWLPGKLALQRSVMSARPDVLFSITSYTRLLSDESEVTGRLVDAGGRFEKWKEENGPGTPFSSLGRLPSGVEDFRVFFGDIYEVLLHEDLVITGILAVRRREAESLLRFSGNIDYCVDWDLCGRLAGSGVCAFLEKDLYRWREHAGPRKSEQPELHLHSNRLRVLHNVWGQDAEFLKVHGAAFQEVVDEDRFVVAHSLLVQGELEAARKELDQLPKGTHRVHRLLSHLPKWFVLSILKVRRVLLGRP